MTIQQTAEAERHSSLFSNLRQRLTQLLGGIGDDEEGGKVRNAALLAFAIRVASAGIAYFSQVLLARWMGSFEYGIFVFVWVWILVLGSLSPVGLSTAVVRLIPEYSTQGKSALLRGLLRGSRLVTLAVSTGLALLGIAGLLLYGDRIETHYLIPGILILFCLPIYSLVDIQDGISRSYGWTSVALLPPYILRPLLLLAAMLVAAQAGFEMNAVTAAGAAIVAAWTSGLWQLHSLQRRLAASVEPGPRETAYGDWLTLALPIFLVSGFALLLGNMDVLILSQFVEPNEIAIYFAALKTMGLINFVHFAVSLAVSRRFSALNAEGDQETLRTFVQQSVAWTFWPSLLATVGLLALGWPLLRLFGAEFTAGYPVMFILAAGFLVRAAVGPAEYVLNMLGEQNRCAAALFFAAILNIGLNYLLIPIWGLEGAAAATALSLAIAYLLFLVVAQRRLGLRLLPWQKRVGVDVK